LILDPAARPHDETVGGISAGCRGHALASSPSRTERMTAPWDADVFKILELSIVEQSRCGTHSVIEQGRPLAIDPDLPARAH